LADICAWDFHTPPTQLKLCVASYSTHRLP